LLASKFFKEIAEIFDDQGLHAGGKYYHFPWEKFAEEEMAGGKIFFRELLCNQVFLKIIYQC